MNRIVNNKVNPGLDILSKFITSGVSVNWLLEGKGSMFANNQTGRDLKNKIIRLGLENGYFFSVRLLSWICDNFDNLERFCNRFKINYYTYYRILFEASIPDTLFIDTLRKAGCNVSWLYTGKGSSYIDNPSGTILKYRKLNKKSSILIRQKKKII